jgi:multicomponent Na+:H+ antiporter subunit E
MMLTGLWIALWGDLSVGNVIGGVLVAIFVIVVAPVDRRSATLSVRPFALAGLALVFLWDLIVASVEVAGLVIRPRAKVEPTIIAVALSTTSDTIVTIVANMVSLTPGTLTLDARHDPTTLYIHVLDARRRDRVITDVHALEARVVRAVRTHRPRETVALRGGAEESA